jgi:hypothetical protein
MKNWTWLGASVVIGFIAGAVAFPFAQERASDTISIRHIEPDPSSRPFPLLDARGGSTIEVGGVYEIYFNGSVYVPGLGPRQKLFISTEAIAPDGWLRVIFGDEVKDKGMSNAHVIPIDVPADVVPPAPFEWRLHYTAIAAVSPKLNASGVDSSVAQHWPE